MKRKSTELGHSSATVRELGPLDSRDRSCCNCSAASFEFCCKSLNAKHGLDDGHTVELNKRTQNSVIPFGLIFLLSRYRRKSYGRAMRDRLSLNVKEFIDCPEGVRMPVVDRCCLP